MFKKVQTRLVVLLLLLTIAFAVSLLFLMHSEVQREDIIFREREKELGALFDKITVLKGKPLEMIVNSEYSLWNEMVDFANSTRIDEEWARENIGWLFRNYNFSASWVFNPSFSPVYSDNKFKDEKLNEFPLPKETVHGFFSKDFFVHFFIYTPHGLMEIRGATIHPSVDAYRKTPPRGYFFAGKVWDYDYMEELSDLTGCTMEIFPLKNGDPVKRNGREAGVITFTRVLKGWDGNPVAEIGVRRESAVMAEIRNLSKRQFSFIVMFMGAAIVVLAVSLVYWVTIPLKSLSSSLKTENPGALENLERSGTEFGGLAQLIVKFLGQRSELMNEVAVRKRAEGELEHARADLEEWSKKLEAKVRERTEELRKSQDRLVKSEKYALIGQLATSVSHELRTPLTAIKNSVYLMRMMKLEEGDEKIAKHMTLIEKEVDACTQVISNMLGFARPKEPVRKESSLEEIVKESLAISVIPTNIKVVTQFHGSLPSIMVDSLQIRQVCNNMIKNAVEAMAAGGELTVATSANGTSLIIEFKDTGIGIPPQDLEKIFDPMFSTFSNGTGLGLSVCQQIVDAHGGTIEVESIIGNGTIFRVRLPL